jgi:hypothetical protein
MDFPARKNNGILVMTAEVKAMREDFIARIRDGSQVIESLQRIGRNKTDQQVKCHWGLVVGTILRVFDERGTDLGMFLHSRAIPEGTPVTADIIQHYLYACCNAVGDEGQRKTLSQMDTIEASRFFENCRNHAASAWDIQIPDPDPTWREKQKEQKETQP